MNQFNDAIVALRDLKGNLSYTGKELITLSDSMGLRESIFNAAIGINERNSADPRKIEKTAVGLMIEAVMAKEMRKLGVCTDMNPAPGVGNTFWYDISLPDYDLFVDVKITSRAKQATQWFTTPIKHFTHDKSTGPGQFFHLSQKRNVHGKLFLLMMNLYEIHMSDKLEECEFVISPSWLITAPSFFKENLEDYTISKYNPDRMCYPMKQHVGEFIKYEY